MLQFFLRKNKHMPKPKQIKQAISSSGSGAGRKKKSPFQMDGTSVQFPKDLNKSDIEIQSFKETRAPRVATLKGLRKSEEIGSIEGFGSQANKRSEKETRRNYRKNKSYTV